MLQEQLADFCIAATACRGSDSSCVLRVGPEGVLEGGGRVGTHHSSRGCWENSDRVGVRGRHLCRDSAQGIKAEQNLSEQWKTWTDPEFLKDFSKQNLEK